MENLFFNTVIDNNVKTAAQCDDEFVLLLKGVSVTPHAAGYIIDPIIAHHLEWHVNPTLNGGEVAARILDFSQFNQADGVNGGLFHSGQA